MFRPQPLLVLPRETERWQGASKSEDKYTIAFHPQPLLGLPCKAVRWQGAHKRRTSNVSPSTITSAALHGGAAASTCSPLLITNTMAPAGPPKFRILA